MQMSFPYMGMLFSTIVSLLVLFDGVIFRLNFTSQAMLFSLLSYSVLFGIDLVVISKIVVLIIVSLAISKLVMHGYFSQLIRGVSLGLFIQLLNVLINVKYFESILGILRNYRLEEAVFIQGTMELPLLFGIVVLYRIGKLEKFTLYSIMYWSIAVLGAILLNRRFLILALIQILLYKRFNRHISRVILGLYVFLLPVFWSFLPLIVLNIANEPIFQKYIELLDISTDKLLEASGRIVGWLESGRLLFSFDDHFLGYGDELPAEWFFTDKTRYHHVHNTFLQLWLDGGYIPLSIFVIGIFKIVKGIFWSNCVHVIPMVVLLLSLMPSESILMNLNLTTVLTLIIFQYYLDYGSKEISV